MSLKRHLLAGLALGLIIVPLPCLAGPGAQALKVFIQTHIIDNALYIFVPVAAAALFFYGFRAVVESNSDSALQNVSSSFIHALVGFAVIALATPFTTTFTTGSPVDPTWLLSGIADVASFMLTAATGIFALLVTINGLRLIAAGGDSGEMEKVQKGLISNIAGLLILFNANVIITYFFKKDLDSIITQVEGLFTYILTIIGAGAVIAFIAAGFMLIISVDESLRDRAKRTIIGTLITLAIVMASYTLINFVNALPS